MSNAKGGRIVSTPLRPLSGDAYRFLAPMCPLLSLFGADVPAPPPDRGRRGTSVDPILLHAKETTLMPHPKRHKVNGSILFKKSSEKRRRKETNKNRHLIENAKETTLP